MVDEELPVLRTPHPSALRLPPYPTGEGKFKVIAISVAVGQLPQVMDFRRAYRLCLAICPKGAVHTTGTAGGYDFIIFGKNRILSRGLSDTQKTYIK